MKSQKKTGKKNITNNIKQVSDREFLLKEEQEVDRNHYPECPEIICKISNLLVRALIDTGSEVTCVSSKSVSYTHLDVYKRQESVEVLLSMVLHRLSLIHI